MRQNREYDKARSPELKLRLHLRLLSLAKSEQDTRVMSSALLGSRWCTMYQAASGNVKVAPLDVNVSAKRHGIRRHRSLEMNSAYRVASLHVICPNRILVPSVESVLVRPSSSSSNLAITAFSGEAALTRLFAVGALEQDSVMTGVGDLWEEKQKKSFDDDDRL
jgi:hypothetical protein